MKRYCKKYETEVDYTACILCNEPKPCVHIEVEEPAPDFDLYDDFK